MSATGVTVTRRSSGGWLLALVLLWSLLVPEAHAGGGIYVCPDGRGGKHFTNTPETTSCEPFRSGRTVSFTSVNKWSGSKLSRWGAGRSSRAYEADIKQVADRYRMDPNLIKAVIRAESSFNKRAVSRKGAQGLMQLMPETAREMRVADPFDARENIEGGTRYLRSLLDQFDGDLALALAAYNAGPTLVKKIRRVPAIPETVRYVKRVLAYYEGYSGGRIADVFDHSQINVRGLVTVQ